MPRQSLVKNSHGSSLLTFLCVSTECVNSSVARFARKVLCKFLFLPGCTAAVVWFTGLGNFHKNFIANLVTELLTDPVQADEDAVHVDELGNQSLIQIQIQIMLFFCAQTAALGIFCRSVKTFYLRVVAT